MLEIIRPLVADPRMLAHLPVEVTGGVEAASRQVADNPGNGRPPEYYPGNRFLINHSLGYQRSLAVFRSCPFGRS